MNVSRDATLRLEDEARKMELKMEMLRKTLDGDEKGQAGNGGSDSSRWKSGSAKKPLRNGYVRDVLETKPTRSKQLPRADTTTRPRGQAPDGAAVAATSEESGPSVEAQGTCASALIADMAPVKAGPGGKAASNLQNALRQQSREALEVEAFLAGLGLDRYVSLFNEHGFDCMEVVKEMTESHMREIGMATGHALKLRKRLAELNPPAPPPVPAATQASASANATKKVSFGGRTEEAPRSPGSGTGTGGSLLDGVYDEAANQASFQEAVRAWREGGASATTEGQATSSEPAAPSKPGSFWSSVGADEVNLERCSTPLTQSAPAGTQSEKHHDPAPSEDKLCCYRCYKQFFAKFAVERCSPLDQTTRRLCSDSCADMWINTMKAKAQELQQRHEKLAKLEEVKRVMDLEMKAAPVESGGA